MPDSWLVLKLEAPLLAFGGVTIDQLGVTRDFPAISMLTGLLANALGWRREEWEKHQALQDRLVFACRWDRRDASALTDTQNAQLAKNDRGWTTWGQPEGRGGDSYNAPHRRFRDYHTDASMIVTLSVRPADETPTLDELAAALDRPARPIFIGRKPCLPSAPLRQKDFVVAPTAYQALQRVPAPDGDAVAMRALWPADNGPTDGQEVHRIIDLQDLRIWRTGLHGGSRKVVEGIVLPREAE